MKKLITLLLTALVSSTVNFARSQTVSATDTSYVKELNGQLSQLHDAEKWQELIAYADKAAKDQPAKFAAYVRWDYIGIARYSLKDYEQAIADLDKFIASRQRKSTGVWGGTGTAKNVKVKALLALGRSRPAAIEAVKRGGSANINEGLKIGIGTGDSTFYRQLLDTAIMAAQKDLDQFHPTGAGDMNLLYWPVFYNNVILLIIANRPDEALKMLNNKAATEAGNLDIIGSTDLLRTAAEYVKAPNRWEVIKRMFADKVTIVGKQHYRSFYLPAWLLYADLSEEQKQDLKELQAIVR